MGASAISSREILAYCQLRGFTSEFEMNLLSSVVEALDAVYFEHLAKEREKESNKQQSSR